MTLEAFLRRVVAIVEDAGIPYMLTGSIASAFYAEPRATRDIDLVIAVSKDALERLVASLEAEEFYVSREAARKALRSRRQFNAIDPESGWKVDWIIRRDRPFSRCEFERRRRVRLMNLELPMVTPEDLIVAKLEWVERGGSDLHLRDAAAIVVQRGSELDRDHIEKWVGELELEQRWIAVLQALKRDPDA